MRRRFIVLALLLAISNGAVLAEVSNKGNTLTSTNGRYVFGQISEMRADQYLLDTQTGRVWRLVKDQNEQLILEPVRRIDDNGEKPGELNNFRPTKENANDFLNR